MTKERRAQRDKAINLIAPDENIDAPRAVQYAPMDYSGAIYAIEQEKQYKADIPKTLSAIALDVNDYHATHNYSDEKVALSKQEVDYKIEEDEYNRAQQLRVHNMVYDKEMQLTQALSDARVRGEINGDETGEALSVLDEFKNPEEFDQNPYAQQLWSNQMNQTGVAAVRTAMSNDVTTQRALRDNNLNNAFNVQAAGILHDGATAKDAFASFLANSRMFLEDMEARELPKTLNTAWANLVKDEVVAIKESITAGKITAEEGATSIKALLSSSRDLTFDWKDKDGNPILNEDGTPATVRVTLAESDAMSLLETANGLRRSSSGGMAISAADFKKEFDEIWGISDFDKNGYSAPLRALDDANAVVKNLQDTLDTINNSEWTDAQKAKMRNYVTTKGTQLIITHTLASEMNAAKMPYKQAGSISRQLERDLNGGYKGDWADYKIEIKRADGTTGTISIPEGLRTYVNDDQTAHLYWGRANQILNKFAGNSSNVANFLSVTDSKFNQLQEEALNSLATPAGQSLVTGLEKQRQVNPKTLESLTSYIQASGEYAEAKGAGFVPLAQSTMDNIVSYLNTDAIFTTSEDRAVAAKGIATAMVNGGGAAQALTYLSEKYDGKSTDISNGATMLQAAILLQHDPATLSAFTKKYAAGADSALMKDLTSNTNTMQGTKNADITEQVNTLMDVYKVPEEYQAAIRSTAILANKIGLATGADDTAKFMSNVIKNNFVKLDEGRYGIQSIYKGSAVLRGQNMDNFRAFLADTKSGLAEIRRANGVLPKDAKALGYRVNEKAGTLDLALDGTTITVPDREGNMSAFLSMPVEYTREGSTADLGLVTNYMTTAAAVSFMATDKDMAKTISENSMVDFKAPDKHIDTSVLSAKLDAEEAEIKKGPLPVMYAGLEERAQNRYKKAMNVKDTYVPEASLVKDAITYATVLTDKEYMKDYIERNGNDKNGAIMTAPYTQEELFKVNRGMRLIFKEIPAGEEYSNTIKLLRDAERNRIYAGHVSQGNVSNPVVLSAVGEQDFADQYNSARAAGYAIAGVSLPEITALPFPEKPQLEGKPTGNAANIKYSRPEFENMATRAANKYGVPEQLYKALINQESGWQQGVKSKAGAQGIAQFMPATAKSFGINPLDPVQALDAGAKLLASEYKAFGDWGLALAAYNAGGPAVRKHKGIPPYAETRNYVKNILAKAGMGNNGTYSVDFSLKDNYYKFMDADMDMLKPVSVTRFVNMLNDTNAYKGKVESIITNRPELLENKPEYADYAEFRKLKGASGKPLFVKGDVDGFRLNLKRSATTVGLDPVAKKALADDMQATQSPALPQGSYSTFAALLDTFGDDYSTRAFTDEGCRFGMSRMSAQEYNEYGVPMQVMQNPVMQSRVLAQEFQRASDVLGSTRKAVFALAGGNMVDNEGNLKSWSEIKRDKEAYRKKWLIRPAADPKIRGIVNSKVAAFYNAYQVKSAEEV